MIPWIIFAVVVVPLLLVAFATMRRNTAVAELPASEDEAARVRTEGDFAAAEEFEARWHEEDKKRYHQERLP